LLIAVEVVVARDADTGRRGRWC